MDVGVVLDRLVHPRPGDRFEARLRLAALLQSATGRDIDLVVLNDAPPQLARSHSQLGERRPLPGRPGAGTGTDTGFRNVVIPEYVALDLDRVIEALHRLDPIDRFIAMVRDIERSA